MEFLFSEDLTNHSKDGGRVGDVPPFWASHVSQVGVPLSSGSKRIDLGLWDLTESSKGEDAALGGLSDPS